MSYQVIIRPEAAEEVQVAFDWYEEKSKGLGLEFLRTAEACLEKIRRNPLSYPLAYKQTRKAVLRKFPYSLFYVVEDETIIVLACFHGKRNPIDWLRRVE
ncbi:MAG TPA: type II toxin-antitoxin system RelE/ParE family toxin [Blastocatellia bacterium]|nr:type II toxin-antitoxin system RelE/ParE family toxin [Blastocatellia bacterium]